MIKAVLVTIALILAIFWIVGFLVAHILGPVIHVALAIAVILLIGSFVVGRETA